jgi:protein KTI12
MPLIVMCGFPSSGKTRRANEIKDYFEKNTERKVHIVGDGTMRIEKNTVYAGRTTKSKQINRSGCIIITVDYLGRIQIFIITLYT